MVSMRIMMVFVAFVIAVAVASPIPGGKHHEHVVIHVPYHVHTVHHHHVKKVHVPVVHKEYIHVHDHHDHHHDLHEHHDLHDFHGWW